MEAVVSPRATAIAPDGIIAVGDRPAVLAAHLARAFGLRGHPPDGGDDEPKQAGSRARALRAAGLPTPWFQSTSIDDDPRPIADADRLSSRRQAAGALWQPRRDARRQRGSSSLPRSSACDAAEVAGHADRARRGARRGAGRVVHSRAPSMPSKGSSTHGAFRLLAIFDKPDPLDGPFFEETIYVTPSRGAGRLSSTEFVAAQWPPRRVPSASITGRFTRSAASAATSVYVLEVAARPIGGLCARSLRFVKDGTRRRGHVRGGAAAPRPRRETSTPGRREPRLQA